MWIDGEEQVAHATEISFSCDCLGCLLDARAKGIIDDALYEEVLSLWRDLERQAWGTCPKCGYTHAYISEYQPDVMHCSKCGLYSTRERAEDAWQPFRQGAVIP